MSRLTLTEDNYTNIVRVMNVSEVLNEYVNRVFFFVSFVFHTWRHAFLHGHQSAPKVQIEY